MRIFVILLWIVGSIFATPLLKTGQTSSYDSNGNIVSDGSIKDDGYYQRGATRSYSRSGDIVIDTVTGLQWSDSESISKPWITQASYNVHEFNNTSGDTAITYCESLQLGGYSDWRLPSVQEWETITDDGWLDESLPMELFQNHSTSPYHNMYWTSTRYADYSPWAWNMDIDHIKLGHSLETNIYNVRCVRGEKLDDPVLSRHGEIVIDSMTNLQWQDNEAAKTEIMHPSDAIDYCENMDLGEWSDWRLPNKKELLSIVDYSQASPAIDDSVFINIASSDHISYISSTSLSQAPASPWNVDFMDGNTGLNGFYNVHVRCVRGGDVENEISPFKNEVAKLYVATFNRAPDNAGLNYWTNDSGLTLSQIAQSFFDQPETQVLYPPSTSNRNFIKSVYRNLFNRDPDIAGWDYWEAELNRGTYSKNLFIQTVINGAQDSNISLDATILNNKTSVGLYFSERGLEDVSLAKIVMEGISAEDAAVLFIKKRIDNGEISVNVWDAFKNGDTQPVVIEAFSREWLNGKTLYFVGFDDFGYDEMKWNMSSLTFDDTTAMWREFDMPGAKEDPYMTNYIVKDDGSVLLTELETNMRVMPQQTADFLVICFGDDCNTRLYYDEQKARNYRDSRNNQETVPFTAEMLDGKIFYTRDEDNSGKGYARMTFTATEAIKHEVWYDGNVLRGDDTFSFPYTVENGKIKLDFEGEMLMWVTLEDQDDYAWYVHTEKENYPLDGNERFIPLGYTLLLLL